MDNTREFLETELKKRGWKQADLARASNLDSAVISNIMNGKRKMGEDTGRAIAQAFEMPAEIVFRAVGLLPPINPRKEHVEELAHLAELLDPEDLEDLIELARLRAKKKVAKTNIQKQQSSRSLKPARTVSRDS
jgi:transcriptional regulator with XRE-family HTH domain